MSRDILHIVRNSKFDRTFLNRRADQTGSGRSAVEKDFVISIVLILISELPEDISIIDELVLLNLLTEIPIVEPNESKGSMQAWMIPAPSQT